MTLQASNAAAIVALNALTALFNVGGAGSLVIRSGSVPADVDTAAGGTLLAEFVLDADAFPDATDAAPGAVSVANAIDDVNAAANGEATYFRILDGAGLAVVQGTVSEAGGGGDCIVTSTDFVTGQPCHVVGLTLRHPE